MLTMRKKTYLCISLEFLSSLEVTGEKRIQCSTGAKVVLQFRSGNVARSLDVFYFADIFGLKIERGTIPTDPSNLFSCWGKISGQNTYEAKNANNSLTHQPAIRYFRKFLVNTIFGRKDNSKLNQSELSIVG